MHFHGDIIIIDPGYAAKNNEDAQKSGYGQHMEALGFSQAVYLNTIWQDFGKVRNPETGEILGTVSAETGALCVLYHEELLQYHPDYLRRIGKQETTTVLRNFDGDICTVSDYRDRLLIGEGNQPFRAALDCAEEQDNWCDLNVFGTANDSIVDGPGLRFSVFVQGCPHHCPGCHNPGSHAFEGGIRMTTDELFAKIQANPLLDGVTFSGGEPFCQPIPLYVLGRRVKQLGLNIMTYTGYTFEHLYEHRNLKEGYDALLSVTDWLVDGRFVEELKSLELQFRGSTNQRILDVQKSLREGRAIEISL